MPIHRCTLPNGQGQGYMWGQHGKCFKNKKDALRQAAAAHANGYRGESSLQEEFGEDTSLVEELIAAYNNLTKEEKLKWEIQNYLGKV